MPKSTLQSTTQVLQVLQMLLVLQMLQQVGAEVSTSAIRFCDEFRPEVAVYPWANSSYDLPPYSSTATLANPPDFRDIFFATLKSPLKITRFSH